MKEFIEKLIGRLEEEKQACHINAEVYTERKIGKIIEIVNELAEEHKGGWIPCSERLPEKNKYCLVTYRINGRLWVDTWVFNGVDFNQTEEVEVIAWQPLPEPYKRRESR